MAPHVTALPSPCTFDSPNLPSVVVGQSGDAFRGPGSNTFGISASFTQGSPDEHRTCFTVTGYNDPMTSWVPVLKYGGDVQTCTFDPSPGSLMCPDMQVTAFQDGTHTISYSAAGGYKPFDPVSFVIVQPTTPVVAIPTEVHSTFTQTLTSTRKVIEEHIIQASVLCPTALPGLSSLTNVVLGSTTLTSTAATVHIAAITPPAPTFTIPILSSMQPPTLPITKTSTALSKTTQVSISVMTSIHVSTETSHKTVTESTTEVKTASPPPPLVVTFTDVKTVFTESTKIIPSISTVTPTIIIPTMPAVTPTIVIPSELLNPFSIHLMPSISVVIPQIITANVVTPTIIMPTITITSIPPTRTVTVVSATVITPNVVTPAVVMPTITTIDKAPISSLESIISSLSAANQASDSAISAHVANALAPLPSLAAAVSSLAVHESLVDNPRITSLASAVTSLVMAANANSRSGAVVMSSVVSAASAQLTSNAAAISSLASVNSVQSRSDSAMLSALASADASFKAGGSSILASISSVSKAQSTSQAQAEASFAQAVSSLISAVSAVSSSIKAIESAVVPTTILVPTKTTATVSFTTSATIVIPTPATSIISVPHVTTATIMLTISASVVAPTVTTATVSFTTLTSVLVPTTFTLISSKPFVTTKTAVITTSVSDLVPTVVTKTVSFTTSATVIVPTVITSVISVPEPITATIILTTPATVLATTVLTAPTTVLVPTSITATVSFTTSATVSVIVKETETTSISTSCAKCAGSTVVLMTASAEPSTQQSLVTLTTVLSSTPLPTSSTATIIVVQPTTPLPTSSTATIVVVQSTTQPAIPSPSSTGSAVTITIGSTTIEIPIIPSSVASPQVTTVSSSSIAIETETVLVPSTTTITQPSSTTSSSSSAVVVTINTTTTVIDVSSPSTSSPALSSQSIVTLTSATTTTVTPSGGAGTTQATATSAAPAIATGDVACPDNDGEGIFANTGALFVLECNVDRTDNDITGIDNPQYVNAGDISTCVDICGITPGCVDISLSGSACYLKNGLGSVNSAPGIIGARQVAAAPALPTSTVDDSDATSLANTSPTAIEEIVKIKANGKAKASTKASLPDTASAASAYRSGTFSIPTTTGAAVVGTAPKAPQRTGVFVKSRKTRSLVTVKKDPRKSLGTVGSFVTATSGPKSGQAVSVEGHVWSWNVYCSNFPEHCSHDWYNPVPPNPRPYRDPRKLLKRSRDACGSSDSCSPVSQTWTPSVTTSARCGSSTYASSSSAAVTSVDVKTVSVSVTSINTETVSVDVTSLATKTVSVTAPTVNTKTISMAVAPISQIQEHGGIKIIPHLVYETEFATETEVRYSTKTSTVCPSQSPVEVVTVVSQTVQQTVQRETKVIAVDPGAFSSALVSVYSPGSVPSPVPTSVHNSVHSSLAREMISAGNTHPLAVVTPEPTAIKVARVYPHTKVFAVDPNAFASALVSVYSPGPVPQPIPASVFNSVHNSLAMEMLSAGNTQAVT